jgi:exodeoxyribonuclease V alpha subunit
LGRILFIDKEKSRMVMDFNGEEVALEGVELEDVGLAYAMSIHKSQGSEFPIVIIPLLKQHFLLLQRNLLYTALTRGRHKVFFVGDPVAYQMAVRNAESVSRVTGLKEQLLKFAKMFGLI